MIQKLVFFLTLEHISFERLNFENIFRFLRGGPDDNVLSTQEDQFQDHIHIDAGHTHTDSGHDHEDAGHTHSDSGHSHGYEDHSVSIAGICLPTVIQIQIQIHKIFTAVKKKTFKTLKREQEEIVQNNVIFYFL